jgi:hypothetical protein
MIDAAVRTVMPLAAAPVGNAEALAELKSVLALLRGTATP